MLRSAFALALLVLTGCGKFTKQHECTELAQKVNGFISKSKDGTPNYADPVKAAEESRRLAERYRSLSHELSGLAIRSEELVPHVDRYRKLTEDAATALDGAAVALEKHDLGLARTRRNEFDAAAKSEAPLVKAINDVCSR